MSERDLAALRVAALSTLSEAGRAATAAEAVEPALSALTRGIFDLLGDRDAHLRAGALKAGERQFFVAGAFLVSPDETAHILVAEHGFPPEQHRLTIPIATAHPGWVYEHRVPLILENTDEHDGFKQILKTARMGSAIYGPMIWRGRFLGQIVMAAQARNTFEQTDLDLLLAFSHLATATYIAHNGQRFLDGLAPSPGKMANE